MLNHENGFFGANNQHNMNPLDFCYWLQGLLEISNPKSLHESQINIIKNHLSLVFNPVTSNWSNPLNNLAIYHTTCASC